VVHTCRAAKQGALDALAAAVPGRPGQTAEAIQLAALRHEVERLRSTATEQAVALHLHEGKRVLGLSAGQVPSRVDADTKAGLLVLIDRAESAGWSTRRAAGLLGVDLDRVARASTSGPAHRRASRRGWSAISRPMCLNSTQGQ